MGGVEGERKEGKGRASSSSSYLLHPVDVGGKAAYQEAQAGANAAPNRAHAHVEEEAFDGKGQANHEEDDGHVGELVEGAHDAGGGHGGQEIGKEVVVACLMSVWGKGEVNE